MLIRIPPPDVSAVVGLVSIETSWAIPMLSYGRLPPPRIIRVSIPSTCDVFWIWDLPRAVMYCWTFELPAPPTIDPVIFMPGRIMPTVCVVRLVGRARIVSRLITERWVAC